MTWGGKGRRGKSVCRFDTDRWVSPNGCTEWELLSADSDIR